MPGKRRTVPPGRLCWPTGTRIRQGQDVVVATPAGRYDGRGGRVSSLNPCHPYHDAQRPECARPDLHDEVGVVLGSGVTRWFRAHELRRAS